MARFDFQSPGAAFTNSIAQELARRKAEERQQMLDQLTVNAEQRAQEQAARQAEEHKASLNYQNEQLKDMTTRRNMQELGTMLQFMRRGDDPVARGMRSDLLDLGKSMGAFERQPRPSVSTEEVFSESPVGVEGAAGPSAPAPSTAPEQWGYVGGREEREEADQVAGTANLIAQMMADPARRAKGQFLMDMANANRGRISPEVVAKFTQPDVPLRVMNQNTGKIEDRGTIPADAHIATWTRPPREYRPRNLMPALDPEGNYGLIDQDAVPIDPRTGVAALPEGWSPIRGTGAGGSSGVMPLGISNGAYDAYVDELSIADRDEAGKIASGQMLGIRQRAAKIISEAKVAPRVKDLAVKFVANPQSIGNESMNEKEVMQFRQLMNLLAPTPDAANVYRQNPIQAGDVVQGMQGQGPTMRKRGQM